MQPAEQEEFELADGRTIWRGVGETRVRLEGRVLTRKVIGSQHLALDDREVDFYLIEPTIDKTS